MNSLQSEMRRRIVVLQAASHIDHYAKYQRNPSDLVIPIGGDALYYVNINNWEVCNIGELCSEDEFRVASNEAQLVLDQLIDKLNDYSKKLNPILSLEIGKYYALQLWIIIGQIRYNSFICKSILKKFNPSKMLVYTKKKSPFFMELRPHPDCIFSEVLVKSGFIDYKKIELIELSSTNRIFSLKERVVNIIPTGWLAYIREIRDWLRVFSFHKAPHRLLIIGGGYDWFKVSRSQSIRELFKFNIATKSFKKKLIDNPPKDLLDILNDAVNNSCSLHALSLEIYSDLDFFTKNYEKLKKKLSHYDALVTGVLTYPWDNFLAHIAAKINKPLIVWQHGEKGQTENMASLYSEMYYATHYLTYGSAVKNFYKKWIGKNRLLDIQVVEALGRVWLGKKNYQLFMQLGNGLKLQHRLCLQ